MVALLVAAVSLVAGPAALAAPLAPGSLDPTFGEGGVLLAENPADTAPSEFRAGAREPDGDLALELHREQSFAPYEVREIELRTPAGALVPSFGTNGHVGVEGGAGLAVLADGDLAVGVDSCGGKPSSVMLLDPTGNPVPGFGAGGCGPEVKFEIQRVAVDPQGRLLLAGIRSYCPPCGHDIVPDTEVVVERLLPDGSVDSGYGTNGSVEVRNGDVPGIEEFYGGLGVDAMVVTADGGLVIASGPGLFRLDAAGAIDRSFGKRGGVTFSGEGIDALTLLPDGSLVVGSSEYSKATVSVTKLEASGAPDPGFGSGGTRILPYESRSARVAIATAPAGALLVAMEVAPATTCRRPCNETPVVLRLSAAGQVDPGYGNAGLAAVTLPAPPLPHPDRVTALLSAADGSALVIGGDEGQDAFASAFTATGVPEASFGSGGNLIEHLEKPAELEPQGLMLSPDGRLTVSAWRSTESGVLPDYLAEFDGTGLQLPGPGGGAATETLARGQIVPDGAGRAVSWDGRNQRHILRAAGPPGSLLDPGWGDEGTVKLPSELAAEAIDPAPGGGVIVVGTFAKNKMAILRLGPTGQPLRGFGHRGLVKLAFPHASATACAALVEGDGRIVVTGWVNGHLGAARLLPNGRLDRGYGHGGRVRVRLGKGVYGELIAPWKGGVVIAASRYPISRAYSAGLIRLDHHGHRVRAFGRHGIVREVPEIAPFALFTGAGRIVTVTDPEWEKGHHGGTAELRSYRPDGAPDRAFGQGGVLYFGATQGRGGARFSPAAAVQQPDGKVVVAGTAGEAGGASQAELARFLVR
jgi:uncharacterized delta-60 repeat protein